MERRIKRHLRKVQIRTKNYSANPLRGTIYTSESGIVRLGSVTTLRQAYPKKKDLSNIVEINSVDAVQNSRDKFAMKKCFDKAKIKHALYFLDPNNVPTDDFIPIVAKRRFGYKGKGMKLILTLEEWEDFISAEDAKDCLFEKYYNYAREYRLHICDSKVFLVWRKLRKKNAKNRWYFNDSNCNWVSEQHKLFNKPSNWKTICEESIKAMDSVGLDLGAVDVRVQSDKHENPLFIICEVNSAPSLGKIGVEEYKQQITNFINNKKL